MQKSMKLNKGDVLFCEYLDSDWVNRRYYFKVVSTEGGIRVRELDGWYDGSIQEKVAPIYRFARESRAMPITHGKSGECGITLDGGLWLALSPYAGCVYMEKPNGKYTVLHLERKCQEKAIQA